jgi:poly(3-hydroxyalkanoate) depolymerase
MELDEPWTIEKCAVGGVTIRIAVRFGTDGRPPLLLINGLGASLELWRPFAQALSPAVGVIAFDVPGVGMSGAPLRPYTMGHLSNQIVELVDSFHIDRVDALGVSWGGMLAQHLAVRHPTRVRRLVLLSTAPTTGGIPGSPRTLWQLLNRRRYWDPDYAVALAPFLYGGDLRTEPEKVLSLHSGQLATRRGYRYQWYAGIAAMWLPIYPWISQPTLILAGNDDPIIPLLNAHILNAILPGSRLRVFDGGHLHLLTRPAEIAAAAEAFLAEPHLQRRGPLPTTLRLARGTMRLLNRKVVN